MSIDKKSSPEDKITNISSARKLLVVGLVVALIVGAVYWFGEKESSKTVSTKAPAEVAEPQFLKEGVLVFTDSSETDTLSEITIEVARSEAERAQGLMYRSQMADSLGMLFVFPDSKPRAFWMKNTKISLDIIYVDENQDIVSIYKGVAPFSEKSVPSEDNAQYVVEVNAGYTSSHDIEVGDHIDFQLDNE